MRERKPGTARPSRIEGGIDSNLLKKDVRHHREQVAAAVHLPNAHKAAEFAEDVGRHIAVLVILHRPLDRLGGRMGE
ncbi:hypothetical protein WME83_29770 [Sorangium sp. So ce385]